MFFNMFLFCPLPLPLFALVGFQTPSSPPTTPKVRSFWLKLPFSPSISILVKFRENKLKMSTSIFD